jgi:hypothetical protein
MISPMSILTFISAQLMLGNENVMWGAKTEEKTEAKTEEKTEAKTEEKTEAKKTTERNILELLVIIYSFYVATTYPIYIGQLMSLSLGYIYWIRIYLSKYPGDYLSPLMMGIGALGMSYASLATNIVKYEIDIHIIFLILFVEFSISTIFLKSNSIWVSRNPNGQRVEDVSRNLQADNGPVGVSRNRSDVALWVSQFFQGIFRAQHSTLFLILFLSSDVYGILLIMGAVSINNSLIRLSSEKDLSESLISCVSNISVFIFISFYFGEFSTFTFRQLDLFFSGLLLVVVGRSRVFSRFNPGCIFLVGFVGAFCSTVAVLGL